MIAPGQVVLVKFPFSDLQSTKKRPALILNYTKLTEKVELCTIAMITSRVDGLQLKGDYKMKKWEAIGLLYPSVVRLSKVATLELDLIDKVMGVIEDEDWMGLSKAFKAHFKVWLKK